MLSKSSFPITSKLFYLVASLFLFCLPAKLKAQSIFDANYNDFNFLAANKIHKVGTNGSAVGNVTLYTNIITISGQQIDCIVRTVSLSGGTFTLPGSAPGGTIPFDYSSATGSGMSANQDRFFSPTFNWTAVGSCKFRFEFILGGSYNNTTNTGTPVILQNVYVNTYDIDGNGSANSNQNNEFSAFNTVQYKTGAGSNLTPTYNPTTGATRFRSNSTTNTSVVVDDATRVKVGYSSLSSLEIIVGADGGGAAYYFLDFGQGPAWTVTPGIITTPGLDLNPSTPGLNNSSVSCKTLQHFTATGTSITNSSNAIDELELLFPASDIADGNTEFFIPKTPAAASDSIRLGTFSGSQSISLIGVTYNITKSAGGGIDTMRVRPVSGTFTTAQVETFLDSLRYINIKASPTNGARNFNLTIRESFLKTVPAAFQATVNCTLLPVSWLSFTATKQTNGTVALRWSTAQESNTLDYIVQHSIDGTTWNAIGSVAAAGSSNTTTNYSYTHLSPAQGKNYYRLLQRDMHGNTSYSATKVVAFSTNDQPEIVIKNNPARGMLQLQLTRPATVQLINNNGQLVLIQKLNSGLQNIDVSNYAKGVYLLQSDKTILKVLIQ